MSGTEPESISERELEEFLAQELLSKSNGPRVRQEREEVPEAPEIEEQPITVTDTSTQPEAPEAPEIEEAPEEAEEEEEEAEEEPAVSWAKKKYRWEEVDARAAKALWDQEQMISRQGNQLREAQEFAVQLYENQQQLEQHISQLQTQGMPMSAAEEEWVEQSQSDPLSYARAAAFNGHVGLYHAVVGQVREENPAFANQIEQQIQGEVSQYAAQEQAYRETVYQEPTLSDSLGESFTRLGLDLKSAGPQMQEKVAELGQYHPYVQAMLSGDPALRDVGVQAVYDLARAGTMSTRTVRDEARAQKIRREGELRREAAGVVTGAPHTPPPQEDPFMQAMEAEWRARGQWSDE